MNVFYTKTETQRWIEAEQQKIRKENRSSAPVKYKKKKKKPFQQLGTTS